MCVTTHLPFSTLRMLEVDIIACYFTTPHTVCKSNKKVPVRENPQIITRPSNKNTFMVFKGTKIANFLHSLPSANRKCTATSIIFRHLFQKLPLCSKLLYISLCFEYLSPPCCSFALRTGAEQPPATVNRRTTNGRREKNRSETLKKHLTWHQGKVDVLLLVR